MADQYRIQSRVRKIEENPIDYSYWLAIDLWSLEEAAAILIGSNPNALDLEAAGRIEGTELSNRYQAMWKMLYAANQVHKLRQKDDPQKFLAWAKNKNLPLAAELTQPDEDSISENPVDTALQSSPTYIALGACLLEASEDRQVFLDRPKSKKDQNDLLGWLQIKMKKHGIPIRYSNLFKKILTEMHKELL